MEIEMEVIKLNNTIAEQNKLLMTFVQVVSHSLRNYAHSFSGMTNLIIDSDSEKEKKECLELLKMTSENFTQMATNINKVVSIQNINDYTPEKINIHKYIEEILNTIKVKRKE